MKNKIIFFYLPTTKRFLFQFHKIHETFSLLTNSREKMCTMEFIWEITKKKL